MPDISLMASNFCQRLGNQWVEQSLSSKSQLDVVVLLVFRLSKWSLLKTTHI